MEQNQEIYEEPYQFNPVLWGIIGYLFLLIFRPFEYWEWLADYHIQRTYIIILLAAIIIWPGKRYINHPINFGLLLLLFVMIISMVFAFDKLRAWDHVWEEFTLIVLFFVILLSIRNEKDLKILVIGFIIVTGIYLGKSLWEFFIAGRHVYRMGIRRLIGIDQTYSDPNSFAATITYSLPFAWALWKSFSSKSLKIILVIYSLMSVIAIGFTGSRTGMLALIFFLFLLWIRGKKKIAGVIIMIVMIATGWFLLPDQYKDRFRTIYDDSINVSATESADNRIDHIKWGFQLYSMRPILGWGPGCAPLVVNRVLRESREVQLHNFTAQLLTELGTAGLMAVIILLVMFYYSQKQTITLSQYTGGKSDFKTYLSIACINTTWLLLFNGLSGHNLYRYTWVFVAVILVLSEHFTKLDYEKTLLINENQEEALEN